MCDVFPNVWKEEEVKIAASIRYFIAQEQTGTIWKLHSCGKCPNSQILQNILEKRLGYEVEGNTFLYKNTSLLSITRKDGSQTEGF